MWACTLPHAKAGLQHAGEASAGSKAGHLHARAGLGALLRHGNVSWKVWAGSRDINQNNPGASGGGSVQPPHAWLVDSLGHKCW